MNWFPDQLQHNDQPAMLFSILFRVKRILQRSKTSCTDTSSISSDLLIKNLFLPMGAQLKGLVGPKIDICGVSVVPATCIIPVSLEMKRSDLEMRAATSGIVRFTNVNNFILLFFR